VTARKILLWASHLLVCISWSHWNSLCRISSPILSPMYLEIIILLYTCISIMVSPCTQYKNKHVNNRPWRPIGLWDVKDPTLSRQSAHS
jgi:TRAP-type mannitol/chloroaromatic compound transport system permease small subunit